MARKSREPPVVLVRLVAEPAGTHCAEGGTAVQTGLDLDRDGQLEPTEVTQVDYVCGEVLLTRLAAEPAGAHCVAGGVAIQVGRDRDHDGQLADSEVEHTEYACGDVLSRDVTVATADDAAAIAGIAVIQGNLAITGTAVTDVAFPRLAAVSGSISVRAPLLVQLAAPLLTSTQGDLSITNNPRLATLVLPGLARVGRDLVVSNNPSLPALTLPALAAIDHDVDIESNDALQTLDAPVDRIGRNLRIGDNPVLRQLAWTLHDHLSRADIFTNGLTSLSLAIEPAFGGDEPTDVSAFNNAALETFELTALHLGALDVSDNQALATITIHAIQVDHDMSIEGDSALAQLILDARVQAQPFRVRGSLTLAAPVRSIDAGTFGVNVDGFCEIDATRLVDLRMFGSVGGLFVGDNPELLTIDRVTAGIIDVAANPALTSIRLSQRSLGGSSRITGNAVLAEVVLGAMTSLPGGIELSFNPKLTSVRAPLLTTIDGSLVVNDNLQLAELAMPALVDVGGQLDVFVNPALPTLELPSLAAGGQLFIESNAGLTHLALPQLRRVDTISVTHSPHLPACEVDALFARITGTHNQTGNDTTATCTP